MWFWTFSAGSDFAFLSAGSLYHAIAFAFDAIHSDLQHNTPSKETVTHDLLKLRWVDLIALVIILSTPEIAAAGLGFIGSTCIICIRMARHFFNASTLRRGLESRLVGVSAVSTIRVNPNVLSASFVFGWHGISLMRPHCAGG